MKSLAKTRGRLYDAVLIESERIADEFLAPTKEIVEALNPFRLNGTLVSSDSPLGMYLYRVYGSLHPQTLDYDVRPYLPQYFSIHNTGTRREYDVQTSSGLPGSGVFGPRAFDDALRQAKDQFIRARDEAAFNIAAVFQIYPDAACSVRSALHSIDCLRDENAVASEYGRERTLAAHVSAMLQPILYPPTITFTRGADGAVTIMIPRGVIIPENLAGRVRSFIDTTDPEASLPGNDEDSVRVMKKRDHYHLDHVLWGKDMPSGGVDTIRKGLRDYSRSWRKACGGEGLPRLRESVLS